MRTFAIALCSFVLLVGACKKKDEAKKDEPAKTDTTAAPTEAPKPTEATPPAAPAGDVQKYVDLMVNFGKVFAAAGKDCKKLATDIKKYVADNRATFEEMKKRDAAMTPEQRTAENEKFKPQMDQFMKDMSVSMDACKDSKEVEAAMKEVPM